MKLAVPDLISISYFPAVAAVELGFFKREGLDVTVELLAPVSDTYKAMRDGEVDFVAAGAHAGLAAFPGWRGMKFVCALSQGMYWFLVMRPDLAGERGDLSVVSGKRIAAAPWVDLGLKQLLRDGGIDIERDKVTIAPLKKSLERKSNTGIVAAKAIQDGEIDGFWANGMGAELAVRRGAGKVVLDVRRGDGPARAFGYTLPTLAVADRVLQQNPEAGAAARRAITSTLNALKEDTSLATKVGEKIFPSEEASLIAELVRRDLPYYDPAISPATIASLSQFSRDVEILLGYPSYKDVVVTPEYALA